MRAFFVSLLLVAAGAAHAGEIMLDGAATQGGLMRGMTAPGATVTVDGKAVRVAGDGGFVFGFGRDHGPQAVVEARFSDGAVARETVAVAARRYDEQRIDGLPPAMVTPNAETLARIRAEAARVRAARAHDTDALDFCAGFAWPALGPISGVYGSRRILNGEPRRPHFGVDVAAPEGAPVRAAAAGMVRLAADLYYSGNTVIIDHGFGLSTTYLHLRDSAVAPGQRVARGDIIGAVGATGRAKGVHLDWRLNWFDTRLDPALVVGPMPGEGEAVEQK